MRIGMMADLYKPHISGVTNYISLNKKFLEKKGHEVFVFTFSQMDYQDDESNVIRSPSLPLLDTGYFFNLSYSQQARQLLRTMELAHVHHPFLSGSLALRYCRPYKIPILFTNHTRYDLYSQIYLPPMADVLGVAAVQAYLPTFCRLCNLVISPSAGMRDVLAGFGVDRAIEIVPNGVDLNPFQDSNPAMNRQEFGWEAEDVILIYVGRLGPEKNLPFLLRSFAALNQAYENARLLLIGDGPDHGTLQQLAEEIHIRERVVFAGSVPYERVPAYLKMGDAFTTASVSEVHPLTVIEAMATGLPVLGIRSPGISDTIQDGINGYLVPNEDIASYTAKMARLVCDEALRRQMGAQARLSAAEYNIERTTTLMEEKYVNVIAQAKKEQKSPRFHRFVKKDDL